MAYPTNGKLGHGVEVTIIGTPITPGDDLAIEYPSNAREGASVVHCGPNILEIDVGGTRWRLAPLAASEGVHNAMKVDGMAINVWVIQP